MHRPPGQPLLPAAAAACPCLAVRPLPACLLHCRAHLPPACSLLQKPCLHMHLPGARQSHPSAPTLCLPAMLPGLQLLAAAPEASHVLCG